ncbi:MAG: hypothetical protein Q8P32_03405 [Candidatus Komeilibacteria bacterium]|nr:hypothetical protein [Candidatus Komeilibacteria bacterium]
MSIIDLGKIGIGPMSSEIIEAAFRYSEINKKPLMLIPSKNQIDWDRGYVNNWTTENFMSYIASMKNIYPRSNIFICRDHCGPGFKNNKLRDVYHTLETDIELGFNLIHVDFSNFSNIHNEILLESKKAIEFIVKKNSKILIEIGTDKNRAGVTNDFSKIKKEIKFFTSFVPIKFYVVRTGSLVKEINQIGKFNLNFISKVKKIVEKESVLLKEHNGDYLSEDEILARRGIIDAINIAPQFGVLQTHTILEKCITYGIDYSDFLNQSYESKRWKKWSDNSIGRNRFLCSLIAGHYLFTSDSYKRVYDRLNKHTNIKEDIIAEVMKSISNYVDNP